MYKHTQTHKGTRYTQTGKGAYIFLSTSLLPITVK